MKNLIMKSAKMLNKTIRLSAGVVFGAMIAQFAAAQNDAATIAIMNGQVNTVSGSIIQEGDVIVRNGEIISVGSNLAAPEGATVIDATGKTVTPGIISPYSTIGMVEVGAVAESNDARIGDDLTLGAALNAADAYNPASTLIAVNRAGGVTRAVSVPPAGASIFGGEAIMIDMTGRNRSITKTGLGRSLQLGFDGAQRTGNTRLGGWATLRETLDAAIAYSNNPGGYNERDSEGRYPIADLKALLPVIRGEQKLLVTINRASDIRNLIKLKNNYRLDVVIVGGNEAWREARAIVAADIPVILDPLHNLPSQFENLSASVKNAGLLN